MKKILIITTYKKLYIILGILVVLILTGVLAAGLIHPSAVQTLFRMEEMEKSQLSEENERLKGVLDAIVPQEQEVFYEDAYRNKFIYYPDTQPPSFNTYSLHQVLKEGEDIQFTISSDDPSYERPLYDPSWKDFYFRGWLYLPEKITDARHRLFIFPMGGSANFDFTGNLGIDWEASEDVASQSRNESTQDDFPFRMMQLLVYNFKVTGVKKYENQVALVGTPRKKGMQSVYIIQDDLLLEGEDTKDFLFQLSTGAGYEIDHIYGNVIRHAYLKEQIKEHSVSASLEMDTNKELNQLIKENQSLKMKLSYFIPLSNKGIGSNQCKPVIPNFPMDPDVKTMIQRGDGIRFNIRYQNNEYRRPMYHPRWLQN